MTLDRDRLAAICSELQQMLGRGDSASGNPTVPPERVADAVRHIHERRIRDRFFDPVLFVDPAWNVLLDLYVAAAEKRQISLSSASLAAGVPATTGLRYLDRLADAGLIERSSCTSDRRRVWISLTAQAEGDLSAYFAAIA
jgi:hypothetical protein